MPSNSQSRKRKQPASPSPTNNRPSPYQPTGNDSNRRTPSGGGGGRAQIRRSSNQGTPSSNAPQLQRQSSSRSSNNTTPTPMAPPAQPVPPSASQQSQSMTEDTDVDVHTPQPEKKAEFYIYEYLTDTVLRDWQSVGAAGLRKRIDELAASPDSLDKTIELGVCFQELIKSAISGRSPVGVISRFVEAVIQDHGGEHSLLATAFLEAITVFEGDSMEPNLVTLLNQLRPRPFSEKTLGLVLEPSTLQALGFVTSMFSKKAVRVTTALVYKQRKHNLLREETEGFAKLITEFFTASYSSAPLEVVARTGERVKGLIGAFELDPGRVLDILLDTAACTVVSNARFFVRLLKGSAWWPQHLPTTPEDPASSGAIFDKLASDGIGAFFEKLEHPRGNKVAAQLLGFKFRYYQRPDVTEVTPENLLVLSALLMKIGFIDLTDLYPHLAPQDEAEMNEILAAWKTKLEAKIRGGGRRNALMMAGALSDDTQPPPRPNRTANGDNSADRKATPTEAEPQKKEEEPPKPKKDDNQILVLLKYLLALGALPEALFILAKYPWLPGPCDDIAEHLGRIIVHSIDAIYQPIKVPVPSMGTKKVAWVDSTAGLKTDDLPRRKPMVTFTVSNLKLKAGDIEYRFFWDEWKEGVPVCRTPADVVVLLKTLGRVLGARIGRDPGVMTRICQIGRNVLSKPDCTQEERNDWCEIVRSLIVPGITLTDGNQGTVNEIWQLLAKFPTETRYMLYGEWLVVGKRQPELKSKIASVEKETKDLLKRISKTNVKQMARQLAKVATSNPVTVMSIVLSQVEGYDNLIEVVVDAARYFTPLGFDAVGYCVLKSMSDGNKQRVQADGMLTSRWLQSLSVFCGKIYTRYYRQMDPTPILEYVSRQLKQNNSVELIVLQQLVLSMSGINAESNFNDAQLQGLAGGELLRESVLKQFRDKRAEDTPQTLKKLTGTLTSDYLAAELLVLIAQERQTCVYRPEEADAPLKVLATLYDEIHMILSQYLDVLKMGFTTAEIDTIVPDIVSLCKTFAIEPSVAWWIARPIIRARMNQETATPDGEADVEMKDAANGTPGEEAPPTPTIPGKKSAWHPVLEKLMAEMVHLHPEETWSRISPGFYTTFWQLDIYDIFVPLEAYQAEVNRIQTAVKHSHLDRSDQSKPGEEQRKAKREALLELDQRIQAELKTHIRENSLVRRRLTQEKEHWFPVDTHYNNRGISEGIVNHCLFPRILLSPNDASYCSRFIREVHKMGAPRFHTIGIYDAIFAKGLHTVMFICTQREAENYGRFLKEILTDLHSWHADRTQYEREAHGSSKNLTGFSVKGVLFDWEDFRKILYKWHKALHMAVKNCLSSKEYMHIRNAIVVLKHVHEFFPAVDWIGKNVLEKLEELLKTEKREDLRIAGTTLVGMLKRRESKWMLVSSFQKSEIPTPAQTPAAANLTAAQSPVNGQERPRTPLAAQQSQSRSLSAVANEFIPTSNAQQQQSASATKSQAQLPQRPNTGTSRVPTPNRPGPGRSPAHLDREDGEIDDSRTRHGLSQQQQPSSLPQRPPPLPTKPPTPIRDGPPHLRHDGSGGRGPPMSRRDEMMQQGQQQMQQSQQQQGRDLRREMGRNNASMQHRGGPPMQQQMGQQQQSNELPQRPEMSSRQTTLERRDAQLHHQGRGERGRMSDKPMDHRGPRGNSPLRRGDMRDGRPGDRDFHRQQQGQFDNRSMRMDIDSPSMNPPLRQPLPQMGNPGARGLQQFIEQDERQRGRRLGPDDRTRNEHIGRLNDYVPPPTSQQQQDQHPGRLIPPPGGLERRLSSDDLHRAPPAGPRFGDRGDHRGHRGQGPQQQQSSSQQQQGPQMSQKDMFSASNAGHGGRQPQNSQSGSGDRYVPSHQQQSASQPSPQPQQDLNHGRLQPPEPMIPRGPRDRTSQHGHQRQLSQHGMQQQGGMGIRSGGGVGGSGPGTPGQERRMDMPSNVKPPSGPGTPGASEPPLHPDRANLFGQDLNSQAPSNQQPSNVQSNPPTPSGSTSQPPTGPSSRMSDEQRNQRRRIRNIQSQIAPALSPAGINSGPSSAPGTPSASNLPSNPLSRRASGIMTSSGDVESPSLSRRESSRHHRSRGGEERERGSDRERSERDRDRDRDRDSGGSSSRKAGSDRGDREHREHRSEHRSERPDRGERSERGERTPRSSGRSDRGGEREPRDLILDAHRDSKRESRSERDRSERDPSRHHGSSSSRADLTLGMQPSSSSSRELREPRDVLRESSGRDAGSTGSGGGSRRSRRGTERDGREREHHRDHRERDGRERGERHGSAGEKHPREAGRDDKGREEKRRRRGGVGGGGSGGGGEGMW